MGRYPLNRRLGLPQHQSAHSGADEVNAASNWTPVCHSRVLRELRQCVEEPSVKYSCLNWDSWIWTCGYRNVILGFMKTGMVKTILFFGGVN